MARTRTRQRPRASDVVPQAEAVVEATGSQTITYWLLALAAIELGVFAFFGAINRDEGWYLYASHLVFQGKIPYRDFNYFQTPLLPYLYGGPQWLFGSSLLLGRFTSVGLTLVTFLALARCARIIGGESAARWTAGLLCISPPLLYYCALARADAPTTLCGALATLCFLQYRRGFLALFLAPACLLIAAGIRSPLLVSFAVTAAFVWWRTPATFRDRACAAAALGGLAALIALPALVANGHATFNLWTSQVDRSTQWLPRGAESPYSLSKRIDDMRDVWIWYLLVIIPPILLVAHAVRAYRARWRPRWRDVGLEPLATCAVITVLALTMVAPFVTANPFDPRYFAPSSALLVIVVGVAASKTALLPGDQSFKPIFASFVVVLAVVASPFYVIRAQRSLLPRTVEGQEQGAGAVINSYLRPGDQLLAFDTTLEVDTRHPLMPGLEMDMFSYWPRMAPASVAQNRVWDESRLLAAINAGTPKVIALTAFDLTSIIGPTLHQPPAQTPFIPLPLNVLPQLANHYTVRKVIGNYGQWRDNLYILVHNP